MVIKLYNGSIEVDFNKEKHSYKVNGKRVISVTACTSVIDKSRPLIYWAVGLTKDYLLENLQELIDDKIGDKISLHINEAVKQHSIKKQRAADIGTQVHDWAERFIKTQKEGCPEIPDDENVRNGINAFLNWVNKYNVKFISSERVVYSKQYDYVGIMDAEAVIDGKLCPIDFKTSKGIYPEMRFQVAAYQAAAEEESGKKYTGNKWLARFDKETGEFEAHEYTEQDKDFEAFLAALALRRRLKELDNYKKQTL